MPELTLNGQTLHYLEHEISDPIAPSLFLIHGAGGQAINWPTHIRRMEGIQSIALDLPGHGQSTGKGCDSVGAYADICIEVLDQLDLEQVILVGHSMGGAICQQITLAHSERVAGLVLVGTGARLPVPETSFTQIREDFEGFVSYATKYSYGPNSSEALLRLGRDGLGQNPPNVLIGDFMACDQFDSRPRLGEIVAPTLIIGGEHDQMMPPKFSEYLSEEITGAELVVVKKSGHMIMVEYPEKTASVISEWLKKQVG